MNARKRTLGVFAALAAVAALGYLLAGAAILSTGCTEPGDCAFPGELGRSTVGPFFWSFVVLAAVTFLLGAADAIRSWNRKHR